MKTKIKNPILRVSIVLVMSFILINLASILAFISLRLFSISEEYMVEFFQGFIFILAIVFSLVSTKGKLSKHGYKLPIKALYLQAIMAIFVFEAISFTAIELAPITGEGHFVGEYTFLREVLSIWLLASIGEELFTRGFVQGYLQPLRHIGIRIGKLFLSLPVIVGATIFMGIHIPYITMGMDKVLFAILLPSTLGLGLIAGYYREKTESLLPAIMVHMLGNIFPVLFTLIIGL